jgi:hypothetical protein
VLAELRRELAGQLVGEEPDATEPWKQSDALLNHDSELVVVKKEQG